MDDRKNYFYSLAKRLSNLCGKPFAIILVVAFLFFWTVAAVFGYVPLIGQLIVNGAVSIITLLMVILLQNAHKHDIRGLQARIDELVAGRQATERSLPDVLTDSELQQVRDLLQRSGQNDSNRRTHRDKRPLGGRNGHS